MTHPRTCCHPVHFAGPYSLNRACRVSVVELTSQQIGQRRKPTSGWASISAPAPRVNSSGPIRSVKINGPTMRRRRNGNRRRTIPAPTDRVHGSITNSIASSFIAGVNQDYAHLAYAIGDSA